VNDIPLINIILSSSFIKQFNDIDRIGLRKVYKDRKKELLLNDFYGIF